MALERRIFCSVLPSRWRQLQRRFFPHSKVVIQLVPQSSNAAAPVSSSFLAAEDMADIDLTIDNSNNMDSDLENILAFIKDDLGDFQ